MCARWLFDEDESERREWQNPEAILSDAGLKMGFTFMDIGCGAGFFALPAARIVGETGIVYGLDIAAEAIAHAKEKAAAEGLRNLVLKRGEAEKTVFCRSCADMIFYGIVLHDFSDPRKVLANARLMLKPEGRLVDLDWKKEKMRFGPPLQIRFSEREAADLISGAGFKIERITNSGQYFYTIIARLK